MTCNWMPMLMLVIAMRTSSATDTTGAETVSTPEPTTVPIHDDGGFYGGEGALDESNNESCNMLVKEFPEACNSDSFLEKCKQACTVLTSESTPEIFLALEPALKPTVLVATVWGAGGSSARDPTNQFLAKSASAEDTKATSTTTATCSAEGGHCTHVRGDCCPGLTCFMHSRKCWVDYSASAEDTKATTTTTATCSAEGGHCTQLHGDCCPGLTCFMHSRKCWVDYSASAEDTKATTTTTTATCSAEGGHCTQLRGDCCPGLTCFMHSRKCWVDYS